MHTKRAILSAVLHSPVIRGALILHIAFLAAGLAVTSTAAERWVIDVESGAIWFGKNEVRIPGDEGTRFDMRDLTGKGPKPYIRLAAEFYFPERHSLRATVAPLRAIGTGTLDEPVHFAGEDFAEGIPVRGIYRFNSYRLAWRYSLVESETWGLSLGAVGFVRDAKVHLRQRNTKGTKTDIGFVPLAHLGGWTDIGDNLTLNIELEGLAAPQGRALDGAAIARYSLTDQWTIGIGYRVIEGGVDNDDVFNFAWVHHAAASARLRF